MYKAVAGAVIGLVDSVLVDHGTCDDGAPSYTPGTDQPWAVRSPAYDDDMGYIALLIDHGVLLIYSDGGF